MGSFPTVYTMSDAVVLVVGGGGREHALVLGLLESLSVGSVHVAPGNAGTAMTATNHPVSASDIDGIIGLAKTIHAGLSLLVQRVRLLQACRIAFEKKGFQVLGLTRKEPVLRDPRNTRSK